MEAFSESVTRNDTSCCCALGTNTMPSCVVGGLLLLLLLLLLVLLLLLFVPPGPALSMCSQALLRMRLPCLSKHAKSPSITRPEGSTTCSTAAAMITAPQQQDVLEVRLTPAVVVCLSSN